MDVKNMNGATLAYLGDAVIELLVREAVIESGISDPGRLNALARNFVRAKAQSAGVDKILDLLNEDELNIYKRGRNAHGISAPKSASVGEYRRATGMEALFAYLHLENRESRMKELFETAFSDALAEIKHKAE